MESQNNPPVKNQRFLPAPFTQGGLYAAGRPYLRVNTSREEQRAMPAYEEPPVLPGGSFFMEKPGFDFGILPWYDVR